MDELMNGPCSQADIERLIRALVHHKGKLAAYPRSHAEHDAYQFHARASAVIRDYLNRLGVAYDDT